MSLNSYHSDARSKWNSYWKNANEEIKLAWVLSKEDQETAHHILLAGLGILDDQEDWELYKLQEEFWETIDPEVWCMIEGYKKKEISPEVLDKFQKLHYRIFELKDSSKNNIY